MTITNPLPIPVLTELAARFGEFMIIGAHARDRIVHQLAGLELSANNNLRLSSKDSQPITESPADGRWAFAQIRTSSDLAGHGPQLPLLLTLLERSCL